MKMKKNVIRLSVIIVAIIGGYLFISNYFLFMPWEYQKNDALYEDWFEYRGEIEMYLCSRGYETEESGRYCAQITDREVIKDTLLEYMSVSNITHSRKEVEDADFPEDWGETYIIEISRVISRNPDGSRKDGSNLLISYIHENTTLAKSYKGVYYYYNVTDELYDFVIDYDDENIQ